MRPQLFACCLWAAAPTADGHGSMVVPRPRNAVDSDVFPWNATVLPPMYDGWVDQPICPIRSEDAVDKRLTTLNGQSCFWFSNGCAHGCAECDGIHANGGNHPGGTSFCGNRSSKATICDPNMRAYSRAAACGSAEDFTYFNPWRRPGAAPVFDACGMAGGEPLAGKEKMQGAKYTTTVHAKQGDLGSVVLKPMPTGTVWTAGKPAEVSWTMRANHGGGYSYRLCPRTENLTEACFQRMPLDFTGLSSLRWNGLNGKRIWFNGTTIAGDYTTPTNSQWRKTPIPVNDEDDGPDGKIADKGFPAVCQERRAPGASRSNCDGSGKPSKMTCLCSGEYGPNNLEIVDDVMIPASLAAGEYVLSWRYDTESTSQVWSNCADITIVKPA